MMPGLASRRTVAAGLDCVFASAFTAEVARPGSNSVAASLAAGHLGRRHGDEAQGFTAQQMQAGKRSSRAAKTVA